MKPAYHIPLSKSALSMIGEICAIQGQIEWLMRGSLAYLLDTSSETANVILGSTGVGTNADVWKKIVHDKCKEARILVRADKVHKSIKDLAAGRNDFVHAFFVKEVEHVYRTPSGDVTLKGIGFGPNKLHEKGRIVAMRTKGGKRTPIKDLRHVRSIAGEISQHLLKAQHWIFEMRAKQQAERTPSPDRWQLQVNAHPSTPQSRSGKKRKDPPQA